MSDEYKKILVCDKCFHIFHDDELYYQHEENGIVYMCHCGNDMREGLLIIGSEASEICVEELTH